MYASCTKGYSLGKDVGYCTVLYRRTVLVAQLSETNPSVMTRDGYVACITARLCKAAIRSVFTIESILRRALLSGSL